MRRTVEADLTIDEAAEWFAALDDDHQSKFFVAVASIAAKTYENRAESQWLAIGNHLATCECSTEEARELIRSILYGMEHPWTKPPVNLLTLANHFEV